MSVNFHRDEDIEEIFLHVKKLKAECGSVEEISKEKIYEIEISKSDNEKITKGAISDNISPNDIFEVVDEDVIVSTMNLKTSGFCDICGQDIILNENLSGLILLNKFFACKDCCKDASNNVLNSWIETRNAKAEDVKPIALWLMQEKHKNRLV